MKNPETDALRLVQAWLDEPENYGTRMERLVEDLENGADTIPWLVAAFNLAAAPASPLPGGEWRTDFENAPKDGSVFMVGYDDEAAKKAGLFENKDRVYEARWNDIQSTWSARNGFILHSDATHWMPLPAAPRGDA